MELAIEIIAIILGVYLCDRISFIAKNLSYREKFEDAQSKIIRSSEVLSEYRGMYEKKQDEVIKLKGDNVVLQKLNAHHLREIEKLKQQNQ